MEKPILFSTPMVNAIIERRKTQTRRVIKPQPNLVNLKNFGYSAFTPEKHISLRGEIIDLGYGEVFIKEKYKKGDILWVRETWALPVDRDGNDAGYQYKADYDGSEWWKWKPSIFMPKEACRIWLEVINIEPQRLHDISEEDAMAEGISLPNYAEQAIKDIKQPEPSEIFKQLWIKINGEKSWFENPWVWKIEFKIHKIKK